MKEASKLENAEEIFELPISYEERGKEIGRMEEKRAVALNLLKKGLSAELIRETTRLTLKEIEQLKKQL